ncbi:hypothetical protein [Streptomyces sp. CBMA156]|uniref:hypothetical protein n=1 Tax=Streptomyces sp. CBMA156 TaxID=1930280 RepID=UPI001661F37D|nr:hypothetical protein [Streptomyces sp. CBMA156]MBD0669740.1 hypothetical protein [Streptomyces sp. CBMA156]
MLDDTLLDDPAALQRADHDRALLALAGLPELAADPLLGRSAVHRQVRGATSRPDLIVTGPAASVVIELKIDAPEGDAQTSHQGDDFADLPNPVFVYLTPTGRPPGDPRFRPVSLRDLAGELARLLAGRSSRPSQPDAPGRRHADDYLSDLETTVGIGTDDDEDAAFWITHSTALLAAQEAARRLLRQLPARSVAPLGALAAELGGDLAVTTFGYEAVGSKRSYPETAVLVSRPEWIRDGTTVLGFGLGIRREDNGHPGPDPDAGNLAPFHGVYCTDPTLRKAIALRFVSKQWGQSWGWWQRLELTAQPAGTGFVEHTTARLADLVRETWQERAATVDLLWAAHHAS